MNKNQSHLYATPDFDEIMESIIAGLAPMTIGSKARQPRFYWGDGGDLIPFLDVYKEDHFPLAFSITKEDKEDPNNEGLFIRSQAELMLCTPETELKLLNYERLQRSYKLTLKPFWSAIHRAIQLSPYIRILPTTLGFAKFPDYSVSGELEAPIYWDVLRVRFDAEININFYCNV